MRVFDIVLRYVVFPVSCPVLFVVVVRLARRTWDELMEGGSWRW